MTQQSSSQVDNDEETSSTTSSLTYEDCLFPTNELNSFLELASLLEQINSSLDILFHRVCSMEKHLQMKQICVTDTIKR